MNVIQAIILALIQGVTEFLPVSSSGHLALFGHLFGMKSPDIDYDIVLHLATLVAVLIYYRKTLFDLTVSLFSRKKGEGFATDPLRFLLFVILTSIPTGISGLLLENRIEYLHEQLPVVSACFMLTAVMLWVTHRKQKAEGTGQSLMTFKWWVPVMIGVAQGIAVLPGVSRSGFTIGAAILLGVTASEAADYAFLVSIPAILGAFLLKLQDISMIGLSLNYVVGFVVAMVAGLLSIRLVVLVVRKTRLQAFAGYMVIVSIATLLISMLG